MTKKTRILIMVIVAALITMACTCPLMNLINQFTNPEPEDLLELLPDDLMEQLPEDMDEMLEEVITAVPDVIEEGLGQIPEALGEGDMEDLFNQGVPENIPMVEDYDDVLAFFGTVNYSTSVSAADMGDFFETKMPEYGWTEDSAYLTQSDSLNSYVGEFSNESQMATVSAVETAGETLVTIIVTDK